MIYQVEFSDQSLKDIASHRKSGNKSVLNKILILLDELKEHPFDGTGKPEQLKHDLSGYWSRRINQADRIVYEVIDDVVYIVSMKGHYD